MGAYTQRILLVAIASIAMTFSCVTRLLADESDRWATLTTPIFRTYDQDAGLPNPVTTAIAESGDGFLWVGTEGGLARWDGYHFRSYKPVLGDPDTLPDIWVTTLFTDRHGQLWIGTSAGGLARYDASRDRFVTYEPKKGGLSNGHVTAICDDGGDGLWVATEGGLDHLDVASGKFTSSRRVAGDPTSLPDNRLLSLLRDRNGTLWVGSRGGLARRRASGRFDIVTIGREPADAIVANSLLEDDEGRIWIGTTHRGAFFIAPGQTRLRPVRETDGGTGPQKMDLGQEWVYSMAQAGPDEVWLGTYGQGIVVADARTGRSHRVNRDLLLRQSLEDDTIWALHRDRSGAMWVATNAGLGRLSSSTEGAALTVFGDTSNPRGLSQGDVISLMAASNGNVWAGLRSKGIDVLDPRVGLVRNVPTEAAKPERALPPYTVASLAEWPDGRVYVGDNFGLYRTDADGSHVRRLKIAGRDPAERTAVVFVNRGRLWIAGFNDGIWSIDPDRPGSRVEHFDSGRLTDRRGTAFADGRRGDLWIGTRNGLNHLDLKTHEIERIFPEPNHPSALASRFISALLIDRQGRLWVGGFGGGIAVLTGRTDGRPVFRRIGIADGLPDDNVDSLLSDDAGRIWAATDNGIAVVDPTTFAIHALHRAEGVAISAYWRGSATRTKRGELLFGGAGGLTVIRPDRFRVWGYRPPVVVTKAVVGGKLIPVDGSAPLVVDPDADSLSVEFSSLDYSAPDQNRYSYRLDGFDRDWIDTDATHRLAAYTNLPPGDYTLHVRGSNRDGTWTETTLDVPIHVRPAWFQTLGFQILVALLALAAIFALVQARTAYLLRRERELEEQVALRTRELEESKRRIEEIAYHDGLTGLANRRRFDNDLREIVARARRQRRSFALFLIDLDRFKQINDTLGHAAGDALLEEVARRMRESLRESDRLARLGGDEFAAIIDDLPSVAEGAEPYVETVCRRLVDCFADIVPFNGVAMRASASVGAALYPESGENPDSLFRATDSALYAAKRAGRGTWRRHSLNGAMDDAQGMLAEESFPTVS